MNQGGEFHVESKHGSAASGRRKPAISFEVVFLLETQIGRSLDVRKLPQSQLFSFDDVNSVANQSADYPRGEAYRWMRLRVRFVRIWST